MAGQVDLLMRNEDSTEYHILDYKFIKEPLEKELLQQIYSKYKMMSGPFSRLMDTNYSHYSIQLEIYRYLMPLRKVKTKRLMVVTPRRACSHDPDEDLLVTTTCCMQKINITKIKYTIIQRPCLPGEPLQTLI
jgi:hypothetical protein